MGVAHYFMHKYLLKANIIHYTIRGVAPYLNRESSIDTGRRPVSSYNRIMAVSHNSS